jgi:hypothetical protein
MAKISPVFRAPSPYEEEMLRAQRQQQLAEVLRQQAFMQEPESPTYQGFRAMPTPTNALARILSAYTSKKIGEKAEEAERKAREADVAEFESLRRDLGPQTQVTGPDMFGDPMEMAGKYTPPVTQTVMPTFQDQETRLMEAMSSGSPRAQRYAQLMLSRQPNVSIEALMEASPETRERYQKTRDPFVLAKPPKAGNLPSDVETYQYYVADQQRLNKPVKSFEDWRLTKPPSTVVQNLLPGEKTTNAYTTALSSKLADQDASDLAAGEQALPQIETSYRIRDLLKQNPITGSGAAPRLAFEKGLETMGFSKGNRASITENLMSELAKTTLAAIPTSGLGSGAGFTGSDREFLQDSAAGRKELTAANLEYLARINEKVARINIQKSNRVRSRLRKMPEFVGLPDRFPDVIAPPSYGSRLPDGFDLEKPPR